MKNFKKIAALVALATLAGMCFAPLEGMPEGEKYHPELSQSQLEQLQGGGVAAPVQSSGSAPEIGSGNGLPNSNSNAADMLARSGAQGGDSAALSLKQAGKDQKKPAPKPGANLMFAGLFIILGLGMVVGVRAYLDKTIPEMPTRKR